MVVIYGDGTVKLNGKIIELSTADENTKKFINAVEKLFEEDFPDENEDDDIEWVGNE